MALTINSTRPRVRHALLVLLAAGALTGPPLRAQELPAHVGKVNDFAEVLDTAQRAALEARLAELERATSAEVAVVTMRTLADRTTEDYATDLFNTWGIGEKDRDNGVLVLVTAEPREAFGQAARDDGQTWGTGSSSSSSSSSGGSFGGGSSSGGGASGRW